MTKRDKVTVDEVIGLIHTDKPTDSVDEVRKLRGRTNERFMVDTAGTLIDMVTRDTFDYVGDVVGLLNGYDKENEQLKKDCTVLIYHNQDYRKENEQLKQSVNNLKDTIIKITIAYQRKYDRTIVDLVDEIHDEDITDLIKELQE